MSVQVENLYKAYPTRRGLRNVLKDVNFTVSRGEKLAIVGRNGAGKSTLVRLISGVEQPTQGAVYRNMSVSWPLAFGGAFQAALTGMDNLRFICRIYGVSIEDKIDYVQDFSELGHYLKEPLRTYSAGMRARLSFALSMVIEFDCFLIDEVIAVGDTRFHEKCFDELFFKRADRAMIIISHDGPYIREHCSRIGVLHEGELRLFDDMDEGFAYYHEVYHAVA